MADKPATPDAVAAELAARQHGVLTARQLTAAGLSRDSVVGRVKAGRLHRVHRGVYALGHPGLSDRGGWMAAVLACGPGAVLSHRGAGELWGVLEAGRGGEAIDVTVPTHSGRGRRPGIRLHRSSTLTPASTTCQDQIPVTTPRRTLEDLRPELAASELRDAVRRAEWLRLPIGDFNLLTQRTASELELLFLQLCRRHRLPQPEVNARVGRFRVDFLWRRQRVIVETDGRRAHRGKAATESDLRRDAELAGLGFVVLRFTYADVVRDPKGVAITVRAALTQPVVAVSRL